MKEKIDQYAKGIFEYHMPEVIMTPSALSVSVDAGDRAGKLPGFQQCGTQHEGDRLHGLWKYDTGKGSISGDGQ